MNTSARNQFVGKISNIRKGAVNDEIELTIAGNDKLVVVVTSESTTNLGLSIGKEAAALVKASWVILLDDTEGYLFSARNKFSGAVIAVNKGAVNTEVILSVAEGFSITAIVTNESADKMGLVVGKQVTALVKASHIILAAKR